MYETDHHRIPKFQPTHNNRTVKRKSHYQNEQQLNAASNASIKIPSKPDSIFWDVENKFEALMGAVHRGTGSIFILLVETKQKDSFSFKIRSFSQIGRRNQKG